MEKFAEYLFSFPLPSHPDELVHEETGWSTVVRVRGPASGEGRRRPGGRLRSPGWSMCLLEGLRLGCGLFGHLQSKTVSSRPRPVLDRLHLELRNQRRGGKQMALRAGLRQKAKDLLVSPETAA